MPGSGVEPLTRGFSDLSQPDPQFPWLSELAKVPRVRPLVLNPIGAKKTIKVQKNRPKTVQLFGPFVAVEARSQGSPCPRWDLAESSHLPNGKQNQHTLEHFSGPSHPLLGGQDRPFQADACLIAKASC